MTNPDIPAPLNPEQRAALNERERQIYDTARSTLIDPDYFAPVAGLRIMVEFSGSIADARLEAARLRAALCDLIDTIARDSPDRHWGDFTLVNTVALAQAVERATKATKAQEQSKGDPQ